MNGLVNLYIVNETYQGKIIGKVDDGYHLVQMFEWVTGSPSCMRVMPYHELEDYDMFVDADDWRRHAGHLVRGQNNA